MKIHKYRNMTSGHDIHATKEMFIVIPSEIAGKNAQIERWKGQAIQRWKPWRGSIETGPMEDIRAIARTETISIVLASILKGHLSKSSQT
jgi:hypothetical protein